MIDAPVITVEDWTLADVAADGRALLLKDDGSVREDLVVDTTKIPAQQRLLDVLREEGEVEVSVVTAMGTSEILPRGAVAASAPAEKTPP